jgi:hypothetical protein
MTVELVFAVLGLGDSLDCVQAGIPSGCGGGHRLRGGL